MVVLSIYAGSGLLQGPFSEKKLFPHKVGLRWVVVNGLKWVEKLVFGCKDGEKWVETYFSPTLKPFRDFRENPLLASLGGGGGGELFSKHGREAVPTQHNSV